ncbi:hypothetical protein D3C72_1347160 [compost metagenome]
MMFGMRGRTISSPGVFSGNSLSSSSTMRTSNHSLRIPELPGLAGVPNGSTVMSEHSVNPKHPEAVYCRPNRSFHTCWIAGGNGAPQAAMSWPLQRFIASLSGALASMGNIAPRIDTSVALVRSISGQKLDTEKRG